MLIDRQDVLYAIRSARRSPLLTFVVVLALSVGIGLNAGVFTILNSLFLQPPTSEDPASFVQIYPRYQGWYNGAAKSSSFNAADYDAIRTQAHSLADVAAWETLGITLDDLRRPSSATLVSCNYFRVFGVGRPLLGRFFNPGECEPSAPGQVAVLSEHFWRNNYSSDPQIIGKIIHISRQPLAVVGIVPDTAAHMVAGALWVPYVLRPAFQHGNNAFLNPNVSWLALAGRLRKGYSRADATTELETLMRVRDRAYLEQKVFTLDRKTTLVLTNGSFIHNPAMQGMVVALFALIMGPLALVLLLACTNVTMLFLSRSVTRRGEIAVRLALGAGRGRLMRMLALESFLTAATAGAASVYLARRIPTLLFSFIDARDENLAAFVRADWKLFGFLAVLVLVATVASALAPMRESFRFDLITALKGREGSATMRSRTTGALTVVQIAMSFVLLAAAVLFARMPYMVRHADPGFETHRTMNVPLDIETPPYTEASARAFYAALESRLHGIPGVQSVADASLAPFSVAPISEIRIGNQEKGQGRPAAIDNVSADFFSTFGIALLHGRPFRSTDVPATANTQVAIVSAAFARTFWGKNDPVGQIVVTPEGRRLVVIGVARDMRSEHFGELDGPRLYTLRDAQSPDGALYVRFTGSAASMSTAIQGAVRSLDASQIGTPATVWDFLESGAAAIHSLAQIILFVAGIAVLLAVTGVYGVLSFAISQRTREFGIQMMLGATRGAIFKSVLARGLRQIAMGILFGLILAIPAAGSFMRMTSNGWLRVDAFDLPVYLTTGIILTAISLAAMCLPALRAMRVDPVEALRND